MKKAILVAIGVLLSFGLSSCQKKYGEGHSCRKQVECKKSLKCVNNVCLDISGNASVCKWSLDCLRKLSESNNKDVDQDRALKFYKRLRSLPLKSDCEALAEKGIPDTQLPWTWKTICGPPPIKGVSKPGGSNPFKILDSKIAGAWVPPDDPYFAKRTGPGHYKDVCKAWVKFEVNRKFQGRVIAQYWEEYDCQKVEVVENGKKIKKDQCKLRPYGRTDTHYYLYLQNPGTVHELNFYVETPPSVCKGRVQKQYDTGCYCKGLSDTKITLRAEEDPFMIPEDAVLAKQMKARRKHH
ncbi:MAG: hypothetical protein J7M25_07215 [Deltaproteobacteria bacterium]|nr:hypothetical protein [Deltaproteobacteria bacterium]